MTSTSAVQAQQKFTNVRKRLDQLGYRQPLGIESLPLVERLFADLIHTTESFKNAKLQISKGHTDRTTVDSAVEPYKSDNAILVKENNEIHIHLIKQKEDGDSLVRELKASVRKYEHENADLKFLNNQFVHKLRALEKESKEKTDRILHLQEKNFHAVVQTPGGRKKNIPFRRQRMDIDTTVPPAETTSSSSMADDPYIADLLQIADNKIAELEKDSRILQDEKEILERKVANFRQQVQGRDEEIERLNKMLEGGRPSDVVALDARNRSNERMISHLNIQIDFLQQKSREMEKKLHATTFVKGDLEGQMAQMSTRNTELELELQDVDRMAKRLQTDKDIVIRTADSELNEAKDELEKSRHELDDMDLTVSQMKTIREHLENEISDSRRAHTSKEADFLRLEQLLDKVQDDKKRLSHRVNKLTANEKDLVLEIERLRHRNGPIKKKTRTPSKLDIFIRGLEEDKNYYKEQMDALQKMIRGEILVGSRGKSPSRGRVSSRSASPTRASPTKSEKKTIAHLETIIRVLEEERDHYKKEHGVLKALRKADSPTKVINVQNGDDGMEVMKLKRERDDMRSLLDKFERHMSEIQTNVKVLTLERDQLNNLYEETKRELHNMRREAVRSPKSPKTSLAAQAVLRRVENERDDAAGDLRRMTTERDSLRERLKIATETSLADRARLEQKIEDLEVCLRKIDNERTELAMKLTSLRKTALLFEDQVKQQAIRLSETEDNASQHKSTAIQMRLLTEEAERSLTEAQKKLARKDLELQSQDDRIQRLQEKIAQVERLSSLSKEEMSQLRSTVNAVDREKDSLQVAVDEKTERLACVTDDLIEKDKANSEMRLRIGELEAQLDHVNDNLGLKDREMRSLRRQLDSINEDLTETARGKDISLREIRRLQEDLATMTRENQSLNQDLQDALEEKENLRHQAQEYMTEVKRVEDTLQSKESERSDLLEQYRALSVEAELYQTTSHQLESEGSSLRLEVMTKDSELRRCRDKLESQDRDLLERCHDVQGYEIQVSNITRSIATLEETLRQSEEDKKNLVQDLSTVRDICSRLEANKDSMQRQLTAASLDREQIQSMMDDMKQESDNFRSQINSERGTVHNLEGLLQSNREKEFQTQLSSQEKQTEIQLLKDRLSLNESKIQSQSREITSMRTRNMELEGEVERMRRQLTSERFERERAVQEMRRHGVSPPISDYTSRTTTTSRYRRSDTSYLNTSDQQASPSRNTSDHRLSPSRSGSNLGNDSRTSPYPDLA